MYDCVGGEVNATTLVRLLPDGEPALGFALYAVFLDFVVLGTDQTL